jgi:hypothetical protein
MFIGRPCLYFYTGHVWVVLYPPAASAARPLAYVPDIMHRARFRGEGRKAIMPTFDVRSKQNFGQNYREHLNSEIILIT